MSERLTAAQAILIAAFDLAESGGSPFTEWDLSVKAWEQDRNRFGCRGYEELYPDHKRVMMEIMGKTKKDNPLRRGWMERAGTNRYRITNLGMVEASRLRSAARGEQPSTASAQQIYEPLEKLVFHSVFLEYRRDANEPRSWTSASAFLGLTSHSSLVLDDRLRSIRGAVTQGLKWFIDSGADALRSGPHGGKRTIRREDVQALSTFVDGLESRFAAQIAAIRRRP